MSDRRDILIISDVHGRRDRLEGIISLRRSMLAFGEVLNVIFLGDGLDDLFSCRHYHDIIVHTVRGNCDARVAFGPFGEEIPAVRVLDICGRRILITHGHAFSVKSTLAELLREGARQNADAVLFGHTHCRHEEYIAKGSTAYLDRDIVLFNPGSLGAGEGSFGNLCISRGEMLFSHGSCK